MAAGQLLALIGVWVAAIASPGPDIAEAAPSPVSELLVAYLAQVPFKSTLGVYMYIYLYIY